MSHMRVVTIPQKIIVNCSDYVMPRLGEELFPGSQRTFEVAESHVWFNKAVARWLDIALYKGEL